MVICINMCGRNPHICLSVTPRDIVKMSQNKFRISEFSTVLAFTDHIVYLGFIVHRPKYWSIRKLLQGAHPIGLLNGVQYELAHPGEP